MEQKDELYYEDLIYYIRKISGLSYTENKNKEFIIEQRMQMQEHFQIDEVTKRKIPYYSISTFQTDFFEFINFINELTGNCMESPYDLCMYKELVDEKLGEFIENLQNKSVKYSDDDNSKSNENVKTKK